MENLSHDEPLTAAESLSFAYQSAHSLLKNMPGRPGVVFRPIYEENARSAEALPLNTEDEILPSVVGVVKERAVQLPIVHRPYWNRDIPYNSAEAFGAAIQSFDLHDASLPRSVLPPEDDVAQFIKGIEDLPHRVKIHEQLALALDITGNDLLGAVNVCWIATRFMARGADQRAYPGIYMDGDTIRDWNSQLAQFETYNNSGKNDAPGDNYYFWTHVFGAMVFHRRGYQAKLAQTAFSRGTQIMEFVRKHISTGNQPNITAHQPASALGRQIGLTLAQLF
jgi:hypothetical protein